MDATAEAHGLAFIQAATEPGQQQAFRGAHGQLALRNRPADHTLRIAQPHERIRLRCITPQPGKFSGQHLSHPASLHQPAKLLVARAIRVEARFNV
jgi:hypothetical protein